MENTYKKCHNFVGLSSVIWQFSSRMRLNFILHHSLIVSSFLSAIGHRKSQLKPIFKKTILQCIYSVKKSILVEL